MEGAIAARLMKAPVTGCASLPNARLVSVENAGHMPWIEKPAEVRSAIGTFLAGDWPAAAERVD